MQKGRDILSQYGLDHQSPQKEKASCGGVTQSHTLKYNPPVGPTRIMATNGPGLHGANAGNANAPTNQDGDQHVLSSGVNHGNCGSQGRY